MKTPTGGSDDDMSGYCSRHGLLIPCPDCAKEEMAAAICPTCEAPVGNMETIEGGHHADPNECSVMLHVQEYRDEEITALELDPKDYPMPKMRPLLPEGVDGGGVRGVLAAKCAQLKEQETQPAPPMKWQEAFEQQYPPLPTGGLYPPAVPHAFEQGWRGALLAAASGLEAALRDSAVAVGSLSAQLTKAKDDLTESRSLYKQILKNAVLCDDAGDFVTDLIEDAKTADLTDDGRTLKEVVDD